MRKKIISKKISRIKKNRKLPNESQKLRLKKTCNYIIVPSEFVLNGKNGYRWKTKFSFSGGKTPSLNVVYIRPGPIAPLRNIIDPLHALKTFFYR